jgi:hypothetical protein
MTDERFNVLYELFTGEEEEDLQVEIDAGCVIL